MIVSESTNFQGECNTELLRVERPEGLFRNRFMDRSRESQLGVGEAEGNIGYKEHRFGGKDLG